MLRTRLSVAALFVALTSLSPAVAGITPSGDATRIVPVTAQTPPPGVTVMHTRGYYVAKAIWLTRPINVS